MSARSFVMGKVRQGNITVLDNGKKVKLHNTIIVEQLDYNQVKLNTNGWLTNTTKTAINRYFQLNNVKAYVSQEKFTWYVFINGQKLTYNDNMILTF